MDEALWRRVETLRQAVEQGDELLSLGSLLAKPSDEWTLEDWKHFGLQMTEEAEHWRRQALHPPKEHHSPGIFCAVLGEEKMPDDWSDGHRTEYDKSKNPLVLQDVVMLSVELSRHWDVLPIPTWARDELARVFQAYCGSYDEKGHEKRGEVRDLNQLLGAKLTRGGETRFTQLHEELKNLRLANAIDRVLRESPALQELMRHSAEKGWGQIATKVGVPKATLRSKMSRGLKQAYEKIQGLDIEWLSDFAGPTDDRAKP